MKHLSLKTLGNAVLTLVKKVKTLEVALKRKSKKGNPQLELQEKGVIDSGCSRHMTGNKSYLLEYEEIDGGFVAFGGDPKGGKITGMVKRTGKLDFKDVYFVKELKFNLFSVSQMCDKKNSVLFTDTECVVLSPEFKLLDENHVLLRVPRKDNMYSVDLKNIVPSGGLTYLFAKATLCDNGTKFKNKVMNQFCEMKGIKREFSVARTPQQNGVTERKNRTLIEAARTMLADSKLPTTFWAEAVNTACYVQNRVLGIKPHNKTSYELFLHPTKKCHLLAHGFRKIISYDISKEKPMSNKELESKVEDMVEEVKTKMGELFGTYKERFDFSINQIRVWVSNGSESLHPNNEDNDFLNDYYNVDATSSYETETELDRYLREPKIELRKGQSLDILQWWKVNGPRFPIVSKMARENQAMDLLGRVFDAVGYQGEKRENGFDFCSHIKLVPKSILKCPQKLDATRVAISNDFNRYSMPRDQPPLGIILKLSIEISLSLLV
ncbi:ribonuclease H-like domain-containing protein [Tanacetum coccineum]